MQTNNIGIVFQSAKNRLQAGQNTLESLYRHTTIPFRIHWHHVIGDQNYTQYLLSQHHEGKIHHLFLHHPDDDHKFGAYTNWSSSIFAQAHSALGVPPIQWLITVCDDVEFQEGWLENALETIKIFHDLNIVLWSPYRPPEHDVLRPELKREGKSLWLTERMAPRCVMFENCKFQELGMYNVGVGSTSDWRLVSDILGKGLRLAIIGGYKVLHKDFGFSPAHRDVPDPQFKNEHTDDYLLRLHGGYYGEPGTSWPVSGRPHGY